MYKKLSFILILSSGIALGQTTKEVAIDKNSEVKQTSSTNAVIVSPSYTTPAPLHEEHTSNQDRVKRVSYLEGKTNTDTDVKTIVHKPSYAALAPLNEDHTSNQNSVKRVYYLEGETNRDTDVKTIVHEPRYAARENQERSDSKKSTSVAMPSEVEIKTDAKVIIHKPSYATREE
ncbi:MAG TPA: hypothetical protein VL021_01615 [Brumimicrobium sp.]|nr:hypothetical protein [Brumimicrobium sp.]